MPMRVPSLGREDALEKGMATYSSILAWNPMDRGAWWATVHGVAESRTLLRDWRFPFRCDSAVSTSQSLAIQARAVLVRMDHSARVPTGSLSRAGPSPCALFLASGWPRPLRLNLGWRSKTSWLPASIASQAAHSRSHWLKVVKSSASGIREPWVQILMWPLASLRGLGRFASPLRWPVSFCEQHWSKGTAPGVFGMKRKAQRELENRTKTSVTDYHHTVGPSLVESPSRSLRMNSYPSCWTRLTGHRWRSPLSLLRRRNWRRLLLRSCGALGTQPRPCTVWFGFAPPSPPSPQSLQGGSPVRSPHSLSTHLRAWGRVWIPVTFFLIEFTLFLPLSPQARQLNAQRSSGNSDGSLPKALQGQSRTGGHGVGFSFRFAKAEEMPSTLLSGTLGCFICKMKASPPPTRL